MTPTEPESRSTRKVPIRKWLTIAVVLLSVALSSLSSVDLKAEQEYEKIFQRAFVTFALARSLNGLISAVQGTELALQPAGVGVTLTPGEILDPVNDLVERFSWIMLGATLSLGIQQVLLDIGQWWGIKLIVTILGVAVVWIQFRRKRSGTELLSQGGLIVLRAFLLVLFIRFAVPVSLIANETLYTVFLEPKYQESAQVIETAGAEIESVSAEPIVEESDEDIGLIETLERALSNTRDSLDFRQRVNEIRELAADLVQHLIQLCVVFILQTGIFPIGFLWLFIQVLKRSFRSVKVSTTQ